MIINLDDTLYVVDEISELHRIETINLLSKMIYCEDGTEWEYGTTDITVVIGEPYELTP